MRRSTARSPLCCENSSPPSPPREGDVAAAECRRHSPAEGRGDVARRTPGSATSITVLVVTGASGNDRHLGLVNLADDVDAVMSAGRGRG